MPKNILVVIQDSEVSFNPIVSLLSDNLGYGVETYTSFDGEYPLNALSYDALLDLRFSSMGSDTLSSGNVGVIKNLLALGKGVFILCGGSTQAASSRNASAKSLIIDHLTNDLEGHDRFQVWNKIYAPFTSLVVRGSSGEVLTPYNEDPFSLYGSSYDLTLPNKGILESSVVSDSPGLFKISECGTGYPLYRSSTTGDHGESLTVGVSFPGDSSLNDAYSGNIILWYDLSLILRSLEYEGIKPFIENTLSFLTSSYVDLDASASYDVETVGNSKVINMVITSNTEVARCLWSLGGVGIGEGQSLVHELNQIGTYQINAKVLDIYGRTFTTEPFEITNKVGDLIDVETLSIDASPSSGQIPLSTLLIPISKKTLVEWDWKVNGVTVSTDEVLRYTFTTPGINVVTLDAIDSLGNTLRSSSRVVSKPDSVTGHSISRDLAVEDIPVNFHFRYLKFYGSGEFSSVTNGVSVRILSNTTNPEATGFRRGRGPTIVFGKGALI